MPAPVTKTIEVPCPPDMAFRIFTSDFSKWWPKEKHSVSAMGDNPPPRSVNLDPRVGGKITETADDGEIFHWGSIKTWEPNQRLTVSWHINQPESEATKVDIQFDATAGGTRVTLTHDGWEILGDNAQAMRDGYNNGWVNVFEVCFADACRAKAA